MTADCRVYWGSHGCDLPLGHEPPHVCTNDDGPCSQATDDGEVRYWGYEMLDEWTVDPSVPPELGKPYRLTLFGEDAPAEAGRL